MSAPPRSAPPAPGTRYGGMIGSGEYTAQGMVSILDFVDGEGNLNAVSFRFLNSLFNCVHRLESEVATLQQRLTNAGIP